jgi:hypothetical protein
MRFAAYWWVQVAVGRWRDWAVQPGWRRWILFHTLAGIVGSAALQPTLLPYHGEFLRHWIGSPIEPLFPSYLLVMAALPVMIYQAWELAPAAHPLAWLSATSAAFVMAPLIFVAGSILALPLGRMLGGWTVFVLPLFAVGSLWAAPIQWLAVKRRIRFVRWWRAAGPALGLAAIAAVVGFDTGPQSWEDERFIWNYGIPLAALIYAVGTLPVISTLLRPKDGPLIPSGTL